MDPYQQQIEEARYQGVLCIDHQPLTRLGTGGAGGVVQARLQGETITITWRGGKQSTVEWAEVQSRLGGGMARLPPPLLVFLDRSGGVGLYFASNSALQGLLPREPNSVIEAVGRLSQEGFVAAE